MTEALRTVRGVRGAEARRRAAQVLDEVGIDDGERRLRQYPHELSGGLLQRVMIGAALLTEPRLMLADEPTTALDVTTQAEVMAILDELRRDRGLALLFITHDLELASAVCDRTTVMYAGEVMETQPASRLHDDPWHPYSAALVAARPRIDATAERLAAIPGRPLSAFEAPRGLLVRRPAACTSRTAAARPHPQLRPTPAGVVRCIRAEEIHARRTGGDRMAERRRRGGGPAQGVRPAGRGRRRVVPRRARPARSPSWASRAPARPPSRG